jgi:hypothetical protein
VAAAVAHQQRVLQAMFLQEKAAMVLRLALLAHL